jgi:glycosyltransferase involved in cell wall biosynthesis
MLVQTQSVMSMACKKVVPPIRVAIQQYYFATYNEPPFARLSSSPGYEFVIIHGKSTDVDDTPEARRLTSLRTCLVANREVSILGFRIRFQSGALRAIASAAFDVVILEGTFGIASNWLIALYCRWKRIPFIWWACGWEKQRVGAQLSIKSWFVSRLVKAASFNIAYGTAARKYLVKHGAREGKVIVAQNTIDTSLIFSQMHLLIESGKALRADLKIADMKVILFVGRLTAAKRVDVLLHAFKKVTSRVVDVVLVIVGNGSEKEALRCLARDENLGNVIFVEGTYDDVNTYFAMCDVFVLPGLGGLALNQAMAFGKPVISGIADGTEMDLIVDGANGYLLQSQTSEELADRLLQILQDEKLRIRMGTESSRLIRSKATIEMMCENVLKAINLSLYSGRSRSPKDTSKR